MKSLRKITRGKHQIEVAIIKIRMIRKTIVSAMAVTKKGTA